MFRRTFASTWIEMTRPARPTLRSSPMHEPRDSARERGPIQQFRCCFHAPTPAPDTHRHPLAHRLCASFARGARVQSAGGPREPLDARHHDGFSRCNARSTMELRDPRPAVSRRPAAWSAKLLITKDHTVVPARSRSRGPRISVHRLSRHRGGTPSALGGLVAGEPSSGASARVTVSRLLQLATPAPRVEAIMLRSECSRSRTACSLAAP